MSKPCILVYGNCQASAVSQTLTKLPNIGSAYEVRYLPSFVHPVDGPAPIDKDWLRRCSIFVEQKGAWSEFPRMAELPRQTACLRFPTVSMNSLWPLQATDPRNVPEPPDYPFGRYPYGDRLVLELLDNGHTGEDLLREYLARDIHQVVDVDRLFELECERLRLADAACDIKMSALVLANLRTHRMFWSYNHPTSLVLKTLSQKIISELGGLVSEMDFVALRQWLDDCYRDWEPAGEISVAIHPQIANHFDLRWVDGGPQYWHFRAPPMRFDEYMLRYINFVS